MSPGDDDDSDDDDDDGGGDDNNNNNLHACFFLKFQNLSTFSIAVIFQVSTLERELVFFCMYSGKKKKQLSSICVHVPFFMVDVNILEKVQIRLLD